MHDFNFKFKTIHKNQQIRKYSQLALLDSAKMMIIVFF